MVGEKQMRRGPEVRFSKEGQHSPIGVRWQGQREDLEIRDRKRGGEQSPVKEEAAGGCGWSPRLGEVLPSVSSARCHQSWVR